MSFFKKLISLKLPKRRFFELILLSSACLVYSMIGKDWNYLVFFTTGFLWNWSASQRLDYVYDKSKYKLSFLKMVYNLHFLFQYPFKNLHPFFPIFAKIFPCGLFLLGLNHFFSSDLLVFPSFLGSLTFEVFQIDSFFNKKGNQT